MGTSIKSDNEGDKMKEEERGHFKKNHGKPRKSSAFLSFIKIKLR